MAFINWLHLSDWHQRGRDFDRSVVRRALIKDLERRVTEIDTSLTKIDFVIFSGDLAWSGKSEEFRTARSEFLDPVLEAINLKPEHIFFVPGNHDLDRDWVATFAPRALSVPLRSNKEVQEWLFDERHREKVLEPFRDFKQFVQGFNGQVDPDYASIRRLEAGGKKIGLVGLNSAWMCARNKDSDGEIQDQPYLVIGEPQVHQAFDAVNDENLLLLVLHHPFDWLAEFDRRAVEQYLEKRSHFIFRGHMHSPKFFGQRGTGSDVIVVSAGAAYDRRIPEHPYYTNSYNFVRVCLPEGKGTVFLRRWSEVQTKWIRDDESCAGGQFEFDLPKSLLPRK